MCNIVWNKNSECRVLYLVKGPWGEEQIDWITIASLRVGGEVGVPGLRHRQA